MERLGVDSGAFARIRRRTDFPHPAITVNNRSYWWGKDIDTWADIPRCTFGARAKGKDTRCFNPQATPGPYDIADLHMCEKHLRRAQSILTRKDN